MLWNQGQSLVSFCLSSDDYKEGFATFGAEVGDKFEKDDCRFKKPTDDDMLKLLATKSFAQNTEKKMLWAITLYREWWYRRCSQPACPPQIRWSNIEKPQTLHLTNFQNALCCFVNKVRRKDQKEFLGETLKQIVIMLQLYLEKQGFNYKLIDDLLMSKFRNTLDNLMKKHAAQGLGHRDSSLSIDLEDEDSLWEKNVLGNSDPDQLRDTVFFLLGINFALCGGEEHKNLRAPGHNPQLTLGKDRAHERFLQYREDVKGKTHQGGLSSKIKPRTLKVYGSSNPSRNVINLFAQYTRLLPNESKNLSLYKYALPASRCSVSQWYSDRPIGVNQLKKVVKNIMTKGGLEGKYTNHSLWATCATRMFEAGVDKQLIKTFTGHKSDCVRDYKRVSETLLRKASSTVSSPDNSSQTKSEDSENPSLEHVKKSKKNSENIDPEHAQFVDEVMIIPTRAHKRPCPITGSDTACSSLCKVLKQIDDHVDQKAKGCQFSLKFEMSNKK